MSNLMKNKYEIGVLKKKTMTLPFFMKKIKQEKTYKRLLIYYHHCLHQLMKFQ